MQLLSKNQIILGDYFLPHLVDHCNVRKSKVLGSWSICVVTITLKGETRGPFFWGDLHTYARTVWHGIDNACREVRFYGVSDTPITRLGRQHTQTFWRHPICPHTVWPRATKSGITWWEGRFSGISHSSKHGEVPAPAPKKIWTCTHGMRNNN